MTDRRTNTQQKIRDGAFRVLLSDGLPHLSFDKIAGVAGVTRQLVRYHYPTSEALMLEVCDALAAVYREHLIAETSDKVGPDRINTFFDFYFDLIDGTAKPRDDQVYDALFSLAAGSPAIRASLRQQYQLLGQVLSHEIKQVHQSIPLESCEEIAYLMISIMYGHWKMVATLGMNPANKRIARRAIDRLIDTYISDPDPVGEAGPFKLP